MTETKKDRSQFKNTLNQLLAGSLSGMAGGTAVAPIATIADYASNKNLTTTEALKKLIAEGAGNRKGLAKIVGATQRLYRGNLLKSLKMAPQTAVGMAIYEIIRNKNA